MSEDSKRFEAKRIREATYTIEYFTSLQKECALHTVFTNQDVDTVESDNLIRHNFKVDKFFKGIPS